MVHFRELTEIHDYMLQLWVLTIDVKLDGFGDRGDVVGVGCLAGEPRVDVETGQRRNVNHVNGSVTDRIASFVQQS